MNPVIPLPHDADARPLQTAPVAVLTPLSTAQKLLLPLGMVLFDWLFWREKGGVNMLVFTVFVVAAQFVLRPRHAAVRRSGYFWLAVAGSLFSGAMMAVYGSGAAALACAASLLLLLATSISRTSGWCCTPRSRRRLGLAQAGGRVLRGLRAPRRAGAGVQRGWFYGRLLLGPLVILGAFHLLFAVANPRYDALSGRALTALGEWLARLLPDISLGHLLFLGLGFAVTAGVVVAVPVFWFADRESRFGEFVRRQRDRVASLGCGGPISA